MIQWSVHKIPSKINKYLHWFNYPIFTGFFNLILKVYNLERDVRTAKTPHGLLVTSLAVLKRLTKSIKQKRPKLRQTYELRTAFKTKQEWRLKVQVLWDVLFL
jgi:cytochrome b561